MRNADTPPDWTTLVRARLDAARIAGPGLDDLVDELAAHLERAHLQAISQGATPDEAYAAARTELAGLDTGALSRRARGTTRGPRRRWSGVAQDLRYGLRALRTRPGFTAAALLTLALGIGANTAIFTVVHAVLIRDLPYREPDRLVYVYETFRDTFDHGSVNPFSFDSWQRDTTAFSHLVPFRWAAATLTGAGDADRVQTVRATADFFDTLGVAPLAGRVFRPDEAEADARVIVVSFAEWAGRFGGDPALVGRAITLDDEPWTVIGIMPASFRFPDRAQYWRPYHLTPAARQNRTAWFLGVIGRLAPGTTIAQAQQQLDAVSARLAEEFPRQRKDRGARVFDMHADLTSGVRSGLNLLQGVAGIVLLIACANLANLQVAQASGRIRELAVRAAIGAHRARLARQLLTENLLLALIGGGLGVLAAMGGVPALVALAPASMQPTLAQVTVSSTTLWFACGLATLTGVLFGMAPALLFSRPNLVDTLRTDGHGATGAARRSHQWLRSGLIAGEVMLAFVLLIGAALLGRSFVDLTAQDPGFRTERLLTATLPLPARYASPESRAGFWVALRDRLSAIPAATAVMASSALPFSRWEWQTDFQLEDAPDLDHNGAGIRHVSAGYFTSLGVPITGGRDFTDADGQGSERVAIVNEAFAERFLGGASGVGQRVRLDRRAGQWLTIVGIAGNTRHVSLNEQPDVHIFVPMMQDPPSLLIVGLRTAGAPESVVPQLREAVRAIDAGVPLQQVRTMDALIGRTVEERRFHLWLLIAFAAVAGALTVVGIYGVTSYVVGLRVREVGIRIALGASPRQVRSLVLAMGLRPVVIGLVGGVTAAWFAVRVIEHQLFGVQARDPWTFAVAAAAFLVVSALASVAPARRGAQVDPLRVLRG